MLELCNHNGAAGQKGTGDHYIMGLPVVASLPPKKEDLSAIGSPIAAVSFRDIVFFQEYDADRIQAIKMCSWAIIKYGEDRDKPAFIYDQSSSAQRCGRGLVSVVEGVDSVTGLPKFVLYALFSNRTSRCGPWADGAVVRLLIDDTEENRGQLSFDKQVMVAKNPNELFVVLDYLSKGSAASRNLLLVSAMGGPQRFGNGANSMITVLEAGPNLSLVGSPVLGTSVSAASGCALDLKSLAVTPLHDNDGFVYIMAASRDSSGRNDWRVVQGRISFLIELAYKIQAGTGTAMDIGDEAFDVVAEGSGYSGNFWRLLYSPYGNGLDGKLFIGYGFDPVAGNGDRMIVFDVTSGGYDPNSRVDIGSARLYGTGDPCRLNTMSSGYMVGGLSGSKSIRTDPVAMEAPMKAKTDVLADKDDKDDKDEK
jgi:hypothetical protein